jgi:hypothetical protein
MRPFVHLAAALYWFLQLPTILILFLCVLLLVVLTPVADGTHRLGHAS